MSEGKNNTVMLTIIGIATLLIAVVGATFAYFSAQVSGLDGQKEDVIKSATVGTTFNGGAEVTAANIYPKEEAWGTKVFSITSNSSTGVTTSYNISLVIDANDSPDGVTPNKTFESGALSYTLTGTESGASTAGTLASSDGAITELSAGKSILLGTATINGNAGKTVTQAYELKFFFKDTGKDQNANQGAQFKAHIVISEKTN